MAEINNTNETLDEKVTKTENSNVVVTEEKKAATKKTSTKKTTAKKPSAKKSVTKKAAEIIIQSPLGGEISSEEILARVGKADRIYVRVDENKAYWVKGEETGSVDLW